MKTWVCPGCKGTAWRELVRGKRPKARCESNCGWYRLVQTQKGDRS